MIERLRVWLGAERDAAALAVFRIAFGVLVSVSATRFLLYGWVGQLFDTTFQFRYWLFTWVPTLSLGHVYVLFGALVVLGLLVALGLFYRLSVTLLFISFAWLQVLDVSNYLNHYYLVCLLALLMAFMPLNRLWSVDALLRPSIRSSTLPTWCTVMLRVQVGLVYFFAGLAKLNADWLIEAAPLHLWLSARTSFPFVGRYFTVPVVALFMSWAGFLFDTSAPFLLSIKRTRRFAYVAVLGFHAATWALFPIGMFPFIMVLSAMVFFDADWPRRAPAKRVVAQPKAISRLALVAAASWCVVQVVMPLRTHFYGGDVSWHEQGMRFSWRVMTREKNGSVTFVVRENAREWHVTPRDYLTRVQERELSVQPDLILQLAHRIGEDWRRKGHPEVEVFAQTMVSLNGKPARALVDPMVDLTKVEDGLGPARWVLP